MTDAQFLEWLETPSAIRMVLIEVQVNVAGQEVTRYIASRPYLTGPLEVPANTEYLPLATGGLAFTEQVSLTGEAGLSGGDIELDNADGALDSWLADVWRNRPIKVWSGDLRWPRVDFRLVFDGIIADVGSTDRNSINLALRDKLQRLDTPITEAKLGGVSTNKDVTLPIPLGECHNVTPLLTNPATLEYGFLGAVESIFEVRTNGKPVPITVDNATGRFKLTINPLANAVTASVQGDNVGGYAPRIAPLVQRIATGYGKVEDRFTAADLDLLNLAAFDAAHPQLVGLYVSDRTNQAQAIQQLAASVGAQALMSRTGKLRLIQIALPAAGVPVEIGPDQMLEGSLHPAQRLAVVAAVKIGYDRNWTVQANLTTSIPPAHADLYATEWLTETVVDEVVKARYRLTDDPPQVDTCLKTTEDAHAEAARRLALHKVQRTIYEFDGEPEMMLLELGQPVVLRDKRFGLQDGAPGVVVILSPSWLTGRVTVGVLV
ncbi:hypothetical protein JAB5_28290 [Janthinobacterium sp. HH103]|uniref:hypothetical protein n=1 Tax=unclassified Janthinobacterium TaxID=2610881 RepID=UPI000873A28B|nr:MULTISPECIES: hypothetical protein [unclassified Janthinobacterium]OEZ70809.1 hypothetical protein JAB2_08710 [Janthinobacterium sp. HH100]OEZ76386.1 hypothetical protein JAB5_28290 [Janthinobacterium sp. HH103]QOU72939.1 hypothetical protein JAB4_023920 [Janthinobacterium sp. HH102]